MALQFTPEGFRASVVMCMTGETAEHVMDVRPGSMLALAHSVADRCKRLSEEQGHMSDEI